jgi:hypothetical protein
MKRKDGKSIKISGQDLGAMAFAGALTSIMAVLLSLLVQPHESPIVATAPSLAALPSEASTVR